MVPLGSPVFPTVGIRGLVAAEAISGFIPADVGTIGLRPVIGVKGESPGDAMERGVNMAKFDPPIMGTEPRPAANHQTFTSNKSNTWCEG